MVSLFVSSVVDRGLEARSGKTKDYKIGMCCFSAKHATLRRKNKDELARNQANVSEWSNMSIRGVVSVSWHYKNPTKRVGLVQSGLHHHLTERNLFSMKYCSFGIIQTITHSLLSMYIGKHTTYLPSS